MTRDECRDFECLKEAHRLEHDQHRQTIEALAVCRTRREAAEAHAAMLRAALEARIEHLAGEVTAARAHRETKGGQQVPFHGDFASAPPSVLRALDWHVAAMREALAVTPASSARYLAALEALHAKIVSDDAGVLDYADALAAVDAARALRGAKGGSRG